MSWLVFVKVLVISLLWLIPGPVSQAYGLGDYIDMDRYDYDPYDEAIEYEILLMELDALGLTFESPEVQGMGPGDIWNYIEKIKNQQATSGEDLPTTREDQP